MAKKARQAYQYEAPVTPSKWTGEEQRFSIRVKAVLEDLYQKFSSLSVRPSGAGGGSVESVNGVLPDANGNVEIPVGGEDGFSPTITATDTSDGILLTITDVNGTKRASVRHGAQGPQGPRGIRGEQGEQGIQGPKGDAGDTGATGATGATGPRGIQGPQGATGATGPQGIQGPKGEKGDPGESGIAAPVSGFFTLSVDADGNLWAYSADGTVPSFEYDKTTGDLYVVQEEG